MEQIDWNTIYTICYVAYICSIIGLILLVILENRNPVKTLSWILVLTFLPVLGLVIYYFFGEDRRQKKRISRKMYRKLPHVPQHTPFSHDNSCSLDQHKQLVDLLYKSDNAPLLSGNSVDIFTQGEDKFRTLIADLMGAKHHIHMEYYIIQQGGLATKIRNVLIEKAKQGIQVRLMYDDVGSWNLTKKFFQPLIQVGGEVEPFLKVAFPLLTRKVNYRNHRKIVVIDGIIGYVGGMNIADRYINGGPFDYWTDFHIRIQGKGVWGLQATFLMDWYYTHKKIVEDKIYFPHPQTDVSSQENAMQVVTSDPLEQNHAIMQGLLYAISNAQKRVYIQTPYFVPSESILQALKMIALSGVDVRIILPSQADSWVVLQASNSFINELLSVNIKVYAYDRGFIHSKLVIVDDTLSIVGSSNMDVRSFEYNFEINAFIYDEYTNERIRHVFEKDLEHTTLITPSLWEKRGYKRRLSESACRLLAPLL